MEREEQGGRAAAAERLLDAGVGGEVGRCGGGEEGLLHKEIVPLSFRKSSIHPDAPLRAESCKSSIDS